MTVYSWYQVEETNRQTHARVSLSKLETSQTNHIGTYSVSFDWLHSDNVMITWCSETEMFQLHCRFTYKCLKIWFESFCFLFMSIKLFFCLTLIWSMYVWVYLCKIKLQKNSNKRVLHIHQRKHFLTTWFSNLKLNITVFVTQILDPGDNGAIKCNKAFPKHNNR